ncbi:MULTISPECIES: HipA domain-containing protein [unclassified Caballeronia]|uniref:HipA domain-containing protein n=1 Tax=unclassified Caballeronia TaxID=2646786 RepID=UPI002864F851|nr:MULTISPECIES: HipA domain-containing protein [unclassified Caballeronia]MDR5776224.1 HipA domain-containing protein [Caballeronia sp. LZ002]MDR5851664.1 HipA domain-containing protein [Caballeronia sp. LZ003]
MTSRTLIAYANGRRVGTLIDENGVWSFGYDPHWVAAKDAFPLSPALPLSSDCVVDGSSKRPVQWFFDNLLPEEAMREALAKEASMDASDAWGLLAYYGRETAGALSLMAEGETEPRADRAPLALEELERRIQAMPTHALTATSPKRMSAAGAQQKLLIILTGEHPKHELFEPVGAEPSMHLLKPDMRMAGYPHSAINEFFCARLARQLSLPIPNTHFLRVPSACYVIDRFDRDVASAPMSRIHTLDATQLLNKDKAFKYNNASAKALGECVSLLGTKALARLALFRWTVFNVLVGNADAHLKNVSFFSRSSGYALAPFYDLVSTVVYNTPSHHEHGERWPHVELSMPIGNARRFAEISRANVLAFAEELGMRASGAEKDLEKMLAELPGAIGRTRAEVNIVAQPSAGEIRLLDSIQHMPLSEMSRALS